jgi:sec-independent protein translocase protein TatB
MLGIGFLEIVVIAVVSFIVFGPEQLPQVMKKLAIYYRQFLALKDDINFHILSADVEASLLDQKTKPAEKSAETIAREPDHG